MSTPNPLDARIEQIRQVVRQELCKAAPDFASAQANNPPPRAVVNQVAEQLNVTRHAVRGLEIPLVRIGRGKGQLRYRQEERAGVHQPKNSIQHAGWQRRKTSGQKSGSRTFCDGAATGSPYKKGTRRNTNGIT